MLNTPPLNTNRSTTRPTTLRSVRNTDTSDYRQQRGTPLRVTIEAPPVIHLGLKALLGEHRDTVRPGRWDVVDTDVVIADVSTQHGLIRLPPTTNPLVVLIRDGDLEADAFVRDVGAVSVPATTTAATLLAALQTAHTLQKTPQVPDGGHSRGPGNDLTTPLSPREIEVLHAICLGLTNTEIADQLYLSINSVKTYIRSAYRKMGVRGRSQAILWGIDHGYKLGAGRPSEAQDEDALGNYG